jgi:DNA (cytosine-5)-methyltransferase 1
VDTADSLIATFQNTGQGWWNESDVAQTIRTPEGSGSLEANIVAFKASHYTRGKDGAPSELAPPLSADADKGDQDTLIAIPILESGARTGKSTDDPRAGSGIGENGDPMFTLQSGKQHAVGFRAAGQEPLKLSEVSPPLCNTDGGGTVPTIGFYANDSGIAFTERGRDKGRTFESQEDLAYALCNPGSGGRTHSRQLFTPMMAVRQLTPLECTRLQGFQDDFFDHVLYRGKPPADGPIYKALGNSMAVPVIAWIGKRIAEVDAIISTLESETAGRSHGNHVRAGYAAAKKRWGYASI